MKPVKRVFCSEYCLLYMYNSIKFCVKHQRKASNFAIFQEKLCYWSFNISITFIERITKIRNFFFMISVIFTLSKNVIYVCLFFIVFLVILSYVKKKVRPALLCLISFFELYVCHTVIVLTRIFLFR